MMEQGESNFRQTQNISKYFLNQRLFQRNKLARTKLIFFIITRLENQSQLKVELRSNLEMRKTHNLAGEGISGLK
jgi:hypothetical protein